MRHGIHWTSTSTAATTYVVNNTIGENGWSGVTRPESTSVVLINNLIVHNGTATDGADNCKCGLGQASAGSTESVTVLNNMFFENGSGNTPESGLQNVNDIASPDNVLSATDSDNFTTTGHANSASSTTAGIVGCTFPDCSQTHALTELFAGPSDFRLRTAAPPSPAINVALSAFVDSGKDWVPDLDFEGDVRPIGPAKDIGFNEAPRQITPTSTPTPGQVTATPTGIAVQNIPTLSGSFFLALGLLLAALGYLLTRNGPGGPTA
jgi:hypothetical protein